MIMVKWSGVRLKTQNPKKTEQWTGLRQSPRTEKENIVRKKRKDPLHYTTLLNTLSFLLILLLFCYNVSKKPR